MAWCGGAVVQSHDVELLMVNLKPTSVGIKIQIKNGSKRMGVTKVMVPNV